MTLREFHRGCWGDTQYPEDMHGIELSGYDSKGCLVDEIAYNYQCRRTTINRPSRVRADIPQLECSVTLSSGPSHPADTGAFEEGYMFSPFYTLSLEKEVTQGGALKSWLTIEKR